MWSRQLGEHMWSFKEEESYLPAIFHLGLDVVSRTLNDNLHGLNQSNDYICTWSWNLEVLTIGSYTLHRGNRSHNPTSWKREILLLYLYSNFGVLFCCLGHIILHHGSMKFCYYICILIPGIFFPFPNDINHGDNGTGTSYLRSHHQPLCGQPPKSEIGRIPSRTCNATTLRYK